MKEIFYRSYSSHRILRFGIIGLVFATMLISAIATVANAAPNASITLNLTPGAAGALLPGETETITWEVVPTTGVIPLQVEMQILDQNGTVLASEIYPGNTGLNQTYYYTLPADYVKPAHLPFERYRVEITYTSTIGEEYGAWGIFIVDDERGDLSIFKFDDRNLNGIYDPGLDIPVKDVLIDVQYPPPYDDTVLHKLTDAAGEVNYLGIATATYTIAEHVPPGTLATTPSEVQGNRIR